MATSLTKTKFIIHPHSPKQQSSRSNNIFLNHKNRSTALQKFTMYSIVGDPTFKDKFYKQKSVLSETHTKLSAKTLDDSMNQTFCHYTRSIQNKTLTQKLSLNKQLQITHDERTMSKAKCHQSRDRKIEKHIKLRANKSKFQGTLTFGSIKQIYVHPNPEKDQLINDNIPQYWKNSLRDNEKRLKRHLKGHSFKRQVADEMLQTLRGRKMLESSIPQIKEQFRSIPCSRTIGKQMRNKRMKGFSLVGKKVTDIQASVQTQYETIRPNFKTCAFDQMYKLQYDPARRWKANEH